MVTRLSASPVNMAAGSHFAQEAVRAYGGVRGGVRAVVIAVFSRRVIVDTGRYGSAVVTFHMPVVTVS